MTWDAYNRRKVALHDVLEIADRRREDVTVSELLADVDGAAQAFGTEAELLLDAQMMWFQSLSCRMDQMLTMDVDNLEAGAVMVWHEVAGAMPGVRTLLDQNADEPALQAAFDHEHRFLARAAGVPVDHRDLLGHGSRIKELARETVVHAPYEEPRQSTFLTRMLGPRAA